jgi:CRP-like cAMP-binding protein
MLFDALVQAIQSLNSEDAFRPRLDAAQWKTFSTYLTRHEIRAGDLLIKQGDVDRTAYFLGQGSLQVFMTGGAPGSSRIAILRAGAIIGETGLFADGPRSSNVEAMTPCVVWALRLPRVEEMAQRAPQLALEVLRAAGGVMAIRMRANLAKQQPIA